MCGLGDSGTVVGCATCSGNCPGHYIEVKVLDCRSTIQLLPFISLGHFRVHPNLAVLRHPCIVTQLVDMFATCQSENICD